MTQKGRGKGGSSCPHPVMIYECTGRGTKPPITRGRGQSLQSSTGRRPSGRESAGSYPFMAIHFTSQAARDTHKTGTHPWASARAQCARRPPSAARARAADNARAPTQRRAPGRAARMCRRWSAVRQQAASSSAGADCSAQGALLPLPAGCQVEAAAPRSTPAAAAVTTAAGGLCG